MPSAVKNTLYGLNYTLMENKVKITISGGFHNCNPVNVLTSLSLPTRLNA